MRHWNFAAVQLLLLLHFKVLSWADLASSPVSPNLFPEPGLNLEQVPTRKEGELTLDLCIRKALLEGTSVLKAEYNSQYSGAQLLQAYGQFLPNFSATANSNYSTGTTYNTFAAPAYIIGSGTNAAYSITTALNIFNGLSDHANLKSAVLKKTSSNLTVYRAKQQIKLDVIQSFYQVMLDHWIVDISESNLRLSREREKLFRAQVEVGQRSLSDLFQQEAQTSSQEFQLLSARNVLLKDQLALLKKLRFDVSKGYRFIEPKLRSQNDPSLPRDEKTLLEIALAHRMDLKASAALAEAERWDIRAAKGSYLPKVDLLGNLSSTAHYLDNWSVNGASTVPPIQNNIGYQLAHQIQYSFGISLTWTIFDRFLIHQTVTRLQTVSHSTELDVMDLKNTVEADVRQAYGDYVTNLQQLRTSSKGLTAAQSSYDVLSGRYSVGGISLLDLLTGQNVLVQALAAHAQALISFQFQNEALRFATGEMEVE